MKKILNLFLTILTGCNISFSNINFSNTSNNKIVSKNKKHNSRNDILLPWSSINLGAIKIHNNFFNPDDVNFYKNPQNTDFKILYDNIKNYSTVSIPELTFRQKFILILAAKLDQKLLAQEFQYFQTSDYFFKTYLKMIQNNDDQFYLSIFKTNREWKSTLNDNKKSFINIENIPSSSMESFYVRLSNNISNNWNINNSYLDFTISIANFDILNGYNFNQDQLNNLSWIRKNEQYWFTNYDFYQAYLDHNKGTAWDNHDWRIFNTFFKPSYENNELWSDASWGKRNFEFDQKTEPMYYLLAKNWPVYPHLNLNNTFANKKLKYNKSSNQNYNIYDPSQYSVSFSFEQICPEFHNLKTAKYFIDFSKLGSITFDPYIDFTVGTFDSYQLTLNAQQKIIKGKSNADIRIENTIKSSDNQQLKYRQYYSNSFWNKNPSNLRKHYNPTIQNEFLLMTASKDDKIDQATKYSDENSYWGFYFNIFAFQKTNTFKINWEIAVKEFENAAFWDDAFVYEGNKNFFGDYCQIQKLLFTNLKINYKNNIF